MSEELNKQLESISYRLLALSKTQASSWGDTAMANATANDAIAIEHAAAELARLRTELAALPRIWRLDGRGELVRDRPVVPGTMLYSRLSNGEMGISWADLGETDQPVEHSNTDGYAPMDFDGFADSEEALRKLMEREAKSAAGTAVEPEVQP